jgi:hypothetical protein
MSHPSTASHNPNGVSSNEHLNSTVGSHAKIDGKEQHTIATLPGASSWVNADPTSKPL